MAITSSTTKLYYTRHSSKHLPNKQPTNQGKSSRPTSRSHKYRTPKALRKHPPPSELLTLLSTSVNISQTRSLASSSLTPNLSSFTLPVSKSNAPEASAARGVSIISSPSLPFFPLRLDGGEGGGESMTDMADGEGERGRGRVVCTSLLR